MSGSVYANHDQLRAAAQHCRTTSEELGSELARLVQRVEVLVSGSLTGATGTALQSVFASINGNLTVITSALDETASMLDRSSNAFIAIDEEAAQNISTADGSEVFRALRPPSGPE
ncbi:WXG100 family type VII secretion target [Micromonospora echinaurantiaca]|uniref:WXG100 family type VII secretion target n=1 Tax=Micromonospora echinaurantiaca TaxID=47857 RepID=UPI0037A20C7C